MKWKKWLRAALIRAVRTIAQTAASMIGVGAVMSDINWQVVGSAALLAGILSLLTSVAGLPEVDNEECYLQMVTENNQLREQLYPGEDDNHD